MILSVSSNL